MRVCGLLLVALLCSHLLFQTSAKIVGVSGQVVWLPSSSFPIPPNVYDTVPSDTSSPVIGGVLYIGTFDEKQGVLITGGDISINPPPAVLKNGSRYDATYIFFHQKQPGVANLNAVGTITLDNKYVGCTSLDGLDDSGVLEIQTDPQFGLSSVAYPNTPEGARGFEAGDEATGSGTQILLTNTITQPGDYTRCFSVSCSDVNGNACQCSVGVSLNGGVCLDTSVTTQTLNLNNIISTQFSSTCDVSATSVVTAIQPSSCIAPGCTLNADGTFTVGTQSPQTLTVVVTAGCGCNQTVPLTLSPCCDIGTFTDQTGSFSYSKSTNDKCLCVGPTA